MYTVSEILVIAKDHSNKENLMQTFENLLQNYLTKFLDIAHKQSLFNYTSRLELFIDHLLVQIQGGQFGGWDTCFCECKKGPHLL